MKRSIHRFLMLALCTLTLASCAKENLDEEITAYNNVAENPVDFSYSNMEVQILDKVNAYRKSLDLPELKPLAEISLEAEDHTTYMAETGQVNHDNFGQRYTDLVNSIGAKAVSENVAFGYHSAEAVVQAWINSEGHRENIEGNSTHFGISVKQDKEGRNYYTNIFVRK